VAVLRGAAEATLTDSVKISITNSENDFFKIFVFMAQVFNGLTLNCWLSIGCHVIKKVTKIFKKL